MKFLKTTSALAVGFVALVGSAIASDLPWVSAPSGVSPTDVVEIIGGAPGASSVVVEITSPAGHVDTHTVNVTDGEFAVDYIPGMAGSHEIVVKSGGDVIATFSMGV